MRSLSIALIALAAAFLAASLVLAGDAIPASDADPVSDAVSASDAVPASDADPVSDAVPASDAVLVDSPVLVDNAPLMGDSATMFPERLEYEISYGVFDVGKSVMQVLRNEDGTISITTHALSDGWVDDIYPVDDFAESVVEDFDSLRPIRYTLKTSEGDRKKHRVVTFDHVAHKATYTDVLAGKERVYDIPDMVFDPLSAFYFTRRLTLEPGTSEEVPMFDSKKFWPMEVKVIKRKRVKVPAGKFDTVQISPRMKSEGIFSRKGDMYIWVTDDERRIPVLIKSKVTIGSIKVELVGGEY